MGVLLCDFETVADALVPRVFSERKADSRVRCVRGDRAAAVNPRSLCFDSDHYPDKGAYRVPFFFRRILYTPDKGKTIRVTGLSCLMILGYALMNGTPNGSPWYMFPLGFLIMIPFVGIAEETGWRGFLSRPWKKRRGIHFPYCLRRRSGTCGIWTCGWTVPPITIETA